MLVPATAAGGSYYAVIGGETSGRGPHALALMLVQDGEHLVELGAAHLLDEVHRDEGAVLIGESPSSTRLGLALLRFRDGAVSSTGVRHGLPRLGRCLVPDRGLLLGDGPRERFRSWTALGG